MLQYSIDESHQLKLQHVQNQMKAELEVLVVFYFKFFISVCPIGMVHMLKHFCRFHSAL